MRRTTALSTVVALAGLLPVAVVAQIGGSTPDFTITIRADGTYELVGKQGEPVTVDLAAAISQNPGAFLLLRRDTGTRPDVQNRILDPLLGRDVTIGIAGENTLSIGELDLQPLGPAFESADRAFRRYAACLNALDTECLQAMTYSYRWTAEDLSERAQAEVYPAVSSTPPVVDPQGLSPSIFESSPSTPLSPTMGVPDGPVPMLQLARRSVGDRLRLGLSSFVYWRMDVSEPFAIDGTDPSQFAVAEFNITRYAGRWTGQRGFLIGVADESGESWRIVDSATLAIIGIDRIIPGYQGSPLPGSIAIRYPSLYAAESKYLETMSGGFHLRGDGGTEGYYDLSFDVRRKIRKDVALTLVFENPQDATRPYVRQSRLVRNQTELRISSPLITNMQANSVYDVAVIAFDPESKEILFEHRQSLLFHPVPDHAGVFLTGLAESSRPATLSYPPIDAAPLVGEVR